MAKHPFHDIAIVGVHNTRQARFLEGETSETVALQAIRGVLDDAGMTPNDIDGVTVSAGTLTSAHIIYQLGIKPAGRGSQPAIPIGSILDGAASIATGQCHTMLIAWGEAALYVDREATAPWTRSVAEFVQPWGVYTAAEFAMIARRHMHLYGTKPEQLATVASTIRNHGHINPVAVYYGRGPVSVEDVLNSRMIADPFHLLDCAMTAEGGSAVILTTAERARDAKQKPVYILGGAGDQYGPAYTFPPSWDLTGWVGREAAKKSFAMAGLSPNDVDVCEFYDPFSFEIIRQFETYGFCKEGEGGDFVMGGRIGLTGEFPVSTDGGLLSHSHTQSSQMLQRVVEGVRQIRGESGDRQVPDVHVAMCSNGGAGALFTHVLLIGDETALP